MPRNAKKNANQHNNRHENGIVAPGKRIVKQKSNGHLNGSPDGRATANTPPLPSPAILPNASSEGNEPSSTPLKDLPNGDHNQQSNGYRVKSAISEETEVTQHRSRHSSQVEERHHRKIDINAAKNPAVHDSSALNLTLTILKSCPLRDTLAILMVLLSLPPTVLAMTNFCFAMLTFTPSVGSLSSLPSLNDITLGSYGAPSFITICITDIIGILLWLIMFTPVQALALDLTQAMVATLLGGGYTPKGGGSNSTLISLMIVTMAHMTRYKDTILYYASQFGFEEYIEILGISEPEPFVPLDSMSLGLSFWQSVKILTALHIVIQGLSQMIRRWYLRREYAQVSASSRKLDPEPSPVIQSNPDWHLQGDSGHSTGNLVSDTINRPIASLKSIPERISSGKRKRKQGSYARMQQPLWAAFASTKVTVIREYEQGQASKEYVGINATDAKNLGSASFVTEDSRIWITLVRPTSFFFDTSVFPRLARQGKCHNLEDEDENEIDKSKPFYIRVNGAIWNSSKIQGLGEDLSPSKHGQQWTGEVYGLSPVSTYQCSFHRCEDGVLVHSAVITTPSSPIVEQGKSSMISAFKTMTDFKLAFQSTPSQQDLRPSSPTSPVTTLKNSITAYETSVNESNIHLRRAKKENKAAQTAGRKELDALQDRLNRVSAAEKSLQTRKVQHNQQMRQAEDAAVSLSDEVETIEKSPEDETSEWKQAKSAWEEQKASHAEHKDKLAQLKTRSIREISALEADALSAQQKRERLQQRSAKLHDQHDRLEASNAQGLDEKERQAQEQRAKQAERDQIEISYQGQLHELTRRVSELQYQARQANAQSQMLKSAYDQRQLMTAQYPPHIASRPSTPEGDLPGTNPPSASGTSGSNFRFPNFGSPESHLTVNGSMPSYSNVYPYQQSHSQQFIPDQHQNFHPDVSNNRVRSLSMLSGNSVYTDFSDQDPAPPMPTRSMVEEMRAQRGSASGSSGGGSSPMVASGSLQGGWNSNRSGSGSAHGWNSIGNGNSNSNGQSGVSSAVTQIWTGPGRGSPVVGTGFADRSLH